ncbi:MAG: HD domain-containing protein [Firmicutes bacterium]|nr:HD domain-containing protein [Bacillota bacterium]
MQHLKENFSPELFAHALGTAETAGALARILGCDEGKARLAGLLHDAARKWPAQDLLSFAKKHNLALDEYCLVQPVLLHAPVGAVLAKEQWGIDDKEILNAIAYHTLGFPGMTLLAQIVYLADKIEPNRSYPQVEELRSLARHNFPKALRMAVANSLAYQLAKNQIIHPSAVTYWNWLVQNNKEGG